MNDGVEAAEREADEERDTEAKTRTPHKDVGKKTCLTDFAIINFAGIHTLSEECCMHRTSLFSILHAALIHIWAHGCREASQQRLMFSILFPVVARFLKEYCTF